MSTFETAPPRISGLAVAAPVCGLVGLCCALVVIVWSAAALSEEEIAGPPTADLLMRTLFSWLLSITALGFGAMATVFGAVAASQVRRSGGKPPVMARLGLALGIAAVVVFALSLVLGLASALWEFNQASQKFEQWRIL